MNYGLTIKILSWEFFLSRFDILFVESQISMQELGEITSFISPDIENSDKSTLKLSVNLLTKVNIFIY
jgi:hypothetical protein